DHETQSQYSFTVIATDAAGNQSDAQSVTLDINDLDDAAPIIKPTEVDKTLAAQSDAGQVVYNPAGYSNPEPQFEAAYDDRDDLFSETLTFEISFDSENQQYADRFSIDQNTGVVTYDEVPETSEDFESIDYTVTATDSVGLSSSVDLTVVISGKEYDAPLFEMPTENQGETVVGFEQVDTELVEQNATGSQEFLPSVSSVRGDISESVSDGDIVIYTAKASDVSQLSYTLSSLSDPALSIGLNTGEVTIAGGMDFDAVSSYTFTVVASDTTGNTTSQDVHLDVREAFVSVDENSENNQIIYSTVPNNSDSTFSLADGHDEALEINAQTGEVILLTSPDFEAKSSYGFTVQVHGDDNEASEEYPVLLSVTNTDDVAPTVDSGDSASSVEENSGVGQVVYTASADDSNDGSGAIEFSLTEESDPALSIDASTGEVTLTVNPDYEDQSSYSFAVIATDDAGNSSEPKSVSLEIGDKDEINPVISSAADTSVDENIGFNQVIYSAVASDPVAQTERGPISVEFDQNSDGVVTLKLFVEESLAGQFANELQGIQFNLNYAADSFAAIALNSVDYTSSPYVKAISESEGTLGFALTYLPADEFVGADVFGLYDAVSTVAIAEVSFNVGADAENIDFSVSDVGIIEYGIDAVTHPSGQSAYQLDLNNSDVAYSMSNASDDGLTISANGQVSLASNVEADGPDGAAEYSFTVVATDFSGNTTSQDVTVEVNDLDDIAPIITSNATATAIDENSGTNQVVYTATADDSQDVSDGVEFSLADGSDSALSIDSQSGEVSLRVNPDSEEQNDYSFTVIATDAAGHSSQKLVTLNINDLDEEAPSITSDLTVNANEGLTVGSVVYAATANDTGDVSDGVTFALALGSDQALFIDSQSGEVRLLDTADYEAQDKYNFTVVVTDNAGNQSEQAVTLRLDNLDEQAPSITSAVEVSVFENIGTDQVIYRAAADDSDDTSAGISFELGENSDPALIIDAQTGVVTLSDSPNFEVQSDYNFTVVVSDGIHASTQAVKLLINDVDESAPVIGSSVVEDITENSGSGNVIYTATADDSAEISGGVSFSLSSDSDAGLSIDTSSGEVSLAHNADFEAKDSYSFTVIATDAEGNNANDSVTVSVDSLTHVDVTHWNSGVGIANTDISIDDQSIATDNAGQVTHGSNTLTASVDASKASSDSDMKAIDVGDALAALDLVSDTNRDDGSYQVLSADVDGSEGLTIGDVLSILKFAAGVEDNSTTIGQWSFAADPVNTNDNDSYAFTGYLTGDVDGSWGTYSARTSDDNQVTIHIDEDSQDQAVFNYDARAMDIHAVGEGLSASGGVISLAGTLDFESRPSMSFTLRDKASGELLVHNVQVGNVDEVAPDFISDVSGTIDSNIANGDVIYTASTDDSADYSAGVVYSLNETSQDISINTRTGDVTFEGSEANPLGYSFTVVANDGVNASEQNVTVNLHEADTLAPLITSGDVSGITEATTAGSVIYTATADDALVVTYSLDNSSDNAVKIDAETGEVSLVDDANYEHQQAYSFTVIATDAEGNSSNQVVTIEVTNLDEVAPVFTSLDEAASIDENSGSGKIIYTAQADDSADVSGGIIFSLAQGSDPALSVDELSGEVTLSVDPDHESQSQYSFTVVATDAADNASEQTVTLNINDLDDANPQVDSTNDVDSIDENSGTYQVVYSASADDSFDDMSEGVTFSLSGHSGFSIDPITGDVTLSLNPDQETEDLLSFTVIATDGANLSSSKTLTLNINDLDDTAPVILPNDSALAFDENSGAGQIVYTAKADDSADVQATPVSFSLTADSDPALTIDADSGDVILADNPDHEIQDKYTFTVVATDGAGNQSEAVSVTLEINDLDEAAPVITSGDSIDAVEENSGSQVIYTVTADDSADVNAGEIIYSLSQDSDSGLGFNASTGEVSIIDSPDADTQDHYSFTVIATDSVGNASEKSLSISIIDLDEQMPTFNSGSIANAINENSGHNQVIYTAQADGNDNALGDDVTYSLEDGHDSALAINSGTGEVYLLANPDADAPNSDQYNFTVIATDSAGYTASQAVTLSVENIDDTAPVIAPVNSVTIDENRSNLHIYTATADDNANELYGEISSGVSFSLAEGSDSALSIDAETGHVTLSSTPDFETQTAYSFTVIASDAAGNVSDSNEVTVSVVNLDETAPVINTGFGGTVVVENSPSGQVVYTASASDTDFNDGENITYDLLGDHLGFDIDSSTGQVTTTAIFNYEDQSQHSFIVVASDDSQNQSVGKPVTVVIANLDDTAPVITSAESAGSILEHTGAGQVVYVATANDSADINEGSLTFSLSSNNDALSIDSQTGVVTLDENPVYAEQEDYSFNIVVTDSAENSSSINVSLNVVSKGILPPPPPPTEDLSINENSGAAQLVYTVGAVNGVVYSLGDGSDPALTIDSVTGSVTLIDNPNFESQDAYQFVVVATNALGEGISTALTLDIVNLDELPPAITSGAVADDQNFSLPGQINENSGSEQVIYTATAVDSGDDIAVGPITFSLAAGHNSGLSIDGDSGVVTLASNPDADTQSLYSFTVIATDGVGNASEQAVTLEVNNLDDTAPSITSGNSAISINENSGANQIVYTATADDSADVQATPVSFKLAAGSDSALTINSVTGEVTLSTDPDHETQSEYEFAVIASDGAGNSSESVSVTLEIINLDDSPPVITSSAEANQVVTNSEAGQVVYSAVADDSADVSDGVTFSLSNDSNGAFSIDSEGVVTLVNQPLYDSSNDPENTGISELSFTIVATDGSGQIDTQEVTLEIVNSDVEAPVFTSPTQSNADENNQFIYQAQVLDASDVIFSLGVGSDLALEIDSNTGVISVKDGHTDYETQDQYQFVVEATDDNGNSSSQVVSVEINNVDEVAPVITSAENIIVSEGASADIYTATATDSDFNGSAATTFELTEDSDGFTILDGVVSFDGSASSDTSFTIEAFDEEGNISLQTVNVAVAEGVNGNTQSNDNIGAIEQKFTQNSDGSYNLQLFVVAEAAPSAIQNMDFTLGFSSSDIEGGKLTINQPSANPFFNIVNDAIDGEVLASQIYFPFDYVADNGLAILDVSFSLSQGVDSTSFTVEQVLFNSDSSYQASSSFDLVNIAEYVGDSGSNVYSLDGGPANVVSGGGEDIFVVTEGINTANDNDSDVVIDFESNKDSIELGQLLVAAGYNADNEPTLITGDTPDLAQLIEANNHDLDNVFGAYLDDSTSILTMFVDSDSSTDSVDVQSYEVTLSEGSTIDDDDLSANLSAFIA
ncbi:MAG: cadherin domain-containing protein, partial [Porticoccaceae bacterium]|nr:cadherin domain-containing protein [Porticoccaceae bacterium]